MDSASALKWPGVFYGGGGKIRAMRKKSVRSEPEKSLANKPNRFSPV